MIKAQSWACREADDSISLGKCGRKRRLTDCAIILVEGVVSIQKYVLVFGRSGGDMNGVTPGPHSAATKAHPGDGVDVVKRYCDVEPLRNMGWWLT